MMGKKKPRVICFALEQEVNYYAPAYRYADEGENPFIPYKDPSQTPFDKADADRILLNERRWANNQANFVRPFRSTNISLIYVQRSLIKAYFLLLFDENLMKFHLSMFGINV